MEIIKSKIDCSGIKFTIKDDDGDEVGRAFLYIMQNDLHKRPFALMEDVFISESSRGSGLGTKLIEQVLGTAKELDCYKLIATSRYSRSKVHNLYIKLGFSDYGKEFKIIF